MKRRLSCALLIFVTSILSTPANANGPWYVGPGYNVYSGYGYNGVGINYGYTPGYGLRYGIGLGLGNWSAQSPYSLEAAGMSNLIRAQGQYNEQSARATLAYEQARSQYIENEQKALVARAASQRVKQAEDAKRREQQHETEVRGAQFAASHKSMPLSHSQLDPTTGRIQWPAILATKDFNSLRQSLDTLFESRAKYGPTVAVSAEIAKKTGELKDLLRGQILTIPLPEYTEARRFLESMTASVH